MVALKFLPARLAAAWGALAAGAALLVAFAGSGKLIGHVPLPKEPAVLVAEAKAILRSAWQSSAPADEAWGFRSNGRYLEFLDDEPDTEGRLAELETVPPEQESEASSPAAPAPVWDELLAAAGLAKAGLVEVPSCSWGLRRPLTSANGTRVPQSRPLWYPPRWPATASSHRSGDAPPSARGCSGSESGRPFSRLPQKRKITPAAA
ncbi:MAG: hypothetical protein R6V57_10440 [Vicinamibacterales bacterium]